MGPRGQTLPNPDHSARKSDRSGVKRLLSIAKSLFLMHVVHVARGKRDLALAVLRMVRSCEVYGVLGGWSRDRYAEVVGRPICQGTETSK